MDSIDYGHDRPLLLVSPTTPRPVPTLPRVLDPDRVCFFLVFFCLFVVVVVVVLNIIIIVTIIRNVQHIFLCFIVVVFVC